MTASHHPSHGAPRRTPRSLPLNRDAVLAELTKLAFVNVHDYMDFDSGKVSLDLTRLTRDHAAGIVELAAAVRPARSRKGNLTGEIVDVKIKLADKRQALLALARHLGLFPDVLEPPGAEESRPDYSDPKTRLEIAREFMSVLAEARKNAKRRGRKARRMGLRARSACAHPNPIVGPR